MYAVVEYKGKQYKAEKGTVLTVDKIDAAQGTVIDVDSVLFVNNDGVVSVGAPYVSGAKIQFEVGESFRDKKVLVFKYKSKKDYHRLHGHRQHYTKVTVKDIIV
ncbi:MAG: 50S ribosomal protein L21 [Treponema sp.]|nr:50S ribosomal protein L21 [Treponema sp.]